MSEDIGALLRGILNAKDILTVSDTEINHVTINTNQTDFCVVFAGDIDVHIGSCRSIVRGAERPGRCSTVPTGL